MSPNETGQGVSELTDVILSRKLQPEDSYEIAAILESMGWSDGRVYEVFGFEDVFSLADEIWQTIQYRLLVTPFSAVEEMPLGKLLYEMVKSFLRGLIFALPMALSVLSMLSLRFSLWSSENLSVEMATCIGIGTILSFVVVGGFTQAIARRGFFYLFQGYYNMGRKISFFFIRIGFVASFAVSVLLYFFNLIFQMYPLLMFGIIVMYFFFLTAIWLSVTVMYILRKELTFTGLIVFGIGLVYLMYVILGLDIIIAQIIAVSIVSVLGMALAHYFFIKAEKREEKGIAPKMTRLSITAYSVKSYFLYGLLYFFFLYVDRIMAWSADRSWAVQGDYMPYFIWFRGDYELGLDFALLALMIPLGVCEVIVNKFMLDIEVGMKKFLAISLQEMNRYFMKKYYRMLTAMLAVATFSALLTYYVIHSLNHTYLLIAGKTLISSQLTNQVFQLSLAGYVILAVGLMNAVMMFSLSQPDMVNRPLLAALGVNLLVGLVLSRWIHYEYAVIGLLAGAIVFAFVTIGNMRRLIKNLDYYLYATS